MKFNVIIPLQCDGTWHVNFSTRVKANPNIDCQQKFGALHSTYFKFSLGHNPVKYWFGLGKHELGWFIGID